MSIVAISEALSPSATSEFLFLRGSMNVIAILSHLAVIMDFEKCNLEFLVVLVKVCGLFL
jgi:hypothetical protein